MSTIEWKEKEICEDVHININTKLLWRGQIDSAEK